MRIRKKVLLIICIVFLLVGIISQLGRAGLTVAPRRFFFQIDQQNTNVVEVTNNTERETQVRVYPHQPEDMNDDWYMGDWLVVYPPVLNLEPGQRRRVRFSVRAPGELEDGEYRTLLYFEQLPAKKTDESEAEDPEVEFELLMRVGINLYGRSGEIDHHGRLEENVVTVEGNNVQITGEFANLGTALLIMETNLRFLNSDGEVVIEKSTPNFGVHRGERRRYEEEIELSDGELAEVDEVEVNFLHEGEAIYGFRERL